MNISDSVRKYGQAPYRIVLLHGGPGASGEMVPVARELVENRGIAGVIETIQTAMSVDGQIEELRVQLDAHCKIPVILAGFSWGAWLAILTAARYPELIGKLLLIGCGPLDEKYAHHVEHTRLDRLGEEGSRRLKSLLTGDHGLSAMTADRLMTEIGELLSGADCYDPRPDEDGEVEFSHDIFHQVWPEAAELRRSGYLLEAASSLSCPVVAMHGDYDPHPYEGVTEALSGLDDFHFMLLERCGHKPWIERQARETFYSQLTEEFNY